MIFDVLIDNWTV